MKQQPSYALYILRRLSYRTGSIPCLLRDIPKIPLIFASASLPLLRAPLTMRGHTMGHHLYHPGGISCVLVKEGWCWWYRKYALSDAELERLEASAREAKKGLWADPQPVPPWEWRAQRRDAAKGSPHAQYEHPNPYAETHQWFVHPVSMVPL